MCERNDCSIQDSPLILATEGLGSSSGTAHYSSACLTTPVRPLPNPALEVTIQRTPTDEEDIDSVERFVLHTCGCDRAIEGNVCSSQISRETYLTHRAQCAKLQKEELWFWSVRMHRSSLAH